MHTVPHSSTGKQPTPKMLVAAGFVHMYQEKPWSYAIGIDAVTTLLISGVHYYETPGRINPRGDFRGTRMTACVRRFRQATPSVTLESWLHPNDLALEVQRNAQLIVPGRKRINFELCGIQRMLGGFERHADSTNTKMWVVGMIDRLAHHLGWLTAELPPEMSSYNAFIERKVSLTPTDAATRQHMKQTRARIWKTMVPSLARYIQKTSRKTRATVSMLPNIKEVMAKQAQEAESAVTQQAAVQRELAAANAVMAQADDDNKKATKEELQAFYARGLASINAPLKFDSAVPLLVQLMLNLISINGPGKLGDIISTLQAAGFPGGYQQLKYACRAMVSSDSRWLVLFRVNKRSNAKFVYGLNMHAIEKYLIPSQEPGAPMTVNNNDADKASIVVTEVLTDVGVGV